MTNIVVYSKPNCQKCNIAKQLLKQRNIEYTEVEFDIGQPRVANKTYVDVAEFKKQHPNATSVPQFEVGGQYLGGFEEFQEWVRTIPSNK